MKRFKVKKGKGELNSTGGNYLCGLLLEGHAKQSLPENFQPRRIDAISDQSVLLTMIGLLSNGRSDFNDVDLYRGDSVFANAYGIERLPSEAVLRQRLDELPHPEHCGLLAWRGRTWTIRHGWVAWESLVTLV